MDKFTQQLLGSRTQGETVPDGFKQPRSHFYNSTIRNYWEQGGSLAPTIPHPYKSNGIPIYRDTTDSSLFENGGKIDKPKYYQYKDHKDQYMKKGNQWYISNQFTDFNFQPIKDPKGTRAKELNKNAKEFNIEEQNTLEGRLNKSLGNPMDRAYRAAEYFAMPGEDPTDNFRHPIAGRYTAEAIEKAVNTGYPIIDKTAAFLGANALGIGHEVGSLIKGKRPLSTTIPEAAEDIYNNFIGTTVGLSSMSPQQKTNYLLRLSDNNQLPDGYGPSATHAPMYWKNPQGKGAYNSKYKNGGELLAQPYPNSFFASDLVNYYADGGPLHDRNNETGKLLNSTYASALGRMFRDGGYFDHGYSLPEDSFKQGGRGLKDSIYASTGGQYPATYKQGGNINVVAGGEKHRVYVKESPTGIGEGIQGHIMVNHPTMDKGQWDTIDLTEKAGAKTVAQGIVATKKWHKENPNSYKQGGSILSMSNTPQLEGEGKDLTYPDGAYVYANGGYTVRRSNDRKGKTHVVIGPDGTKKYFGDPSMGERSKSEHGKEAFYARHKHNLDSNPYFRAYARATWEMGGQMNTYANGGMIKRADGSYSRRGLWDNIRANRGSGKEPTKEMLAQERKIRNERQYGGEMHNAPVLTTSNLFNRYQ